MIRISSGEDELRFRVGQETLGDDAKPNLHATSLRLGLPIYGSSSMLSGLIQGQLDSPARPARVEVMSKEVDANSCPELERAAGGFYAELERLLQAKVPLSELPPVIRPSTITLDGTTYVLQLWTGEGTIVLHPDRDIDKAANDASGILVSSISSCSSDALGNIDEYPVW